MTIPYRRTSPAKLLESAASQQGYIWESNSRNGPGLWAVYNQGPLVALINKTGLQEWVVTVMRHGRVHYRKRHGTYTNTLAALQEQLQRSGATVPQAAALLH